MYSHHARTDINVVLHLRFSDLGAGCQGYHEMRYAHVSKLAAVDYPDGEISQH
jgi:hypothetical protein